MGNQPSGGLPKRHSLRQDDATFIALTIYRHHATRYIISTQLMLGRRGLHGTFYGVRLFLTNLKALE